MGLFNFVVLMAGGDPCIDLCMTSEICVFSIMRYMP